MATSSVYLGLPTPATYPANTRDTAHPRVVWAFDAGVAAFAATTGALLVFGHSRGGTLGPFAEIGRRVARDVMLPYWADATVGLVVHLGEALVLGALMAVLIGSGSWRARVRGALIVTLLWEVAPILASLAAVRADVAVQLTPGSRVVLALLLAVSLALGPRKAAKSV